MKVLLADPPRLEQDYDAAYPNMGILYLIAAARRRFTSGEVSIEYLESQHTIQSHLEAIEKARPDAYGISFASFTSPLAHRTMAEVRERFPQLPIIAGGAHPTAAWDSVLRESPVDICVVGEGEATFCDLLEYYLHRGKQLNEIPGLAFLRQGQPFRTEKRNLLTDLDEIPMPAWDLVDFRKYKGMHLRKAEPQTYMVVSRGCPFDCWFCSNPVWKDNKPWVRLRSPQAIASEIEHLYRRGIREIYLSADEFNVNYEWPLEVARAIQDLGHHDLCFQCNVRADKVTDELAEEFRKMHLWMVHLGIESGNQHTIDGLAKRIQIEQVVNATKVFQKFGIKVFGFVMLYHAWEENGELAFETPKDVDRTLDFCKKLLSKKLLNYMSWQVATPYPGARLWKTAQKFALLPNSRQFSDLRSQSMCLPGISKADYARSLRRGYVLKSWYAVRSGSINFRHLARIRQSLAVILNMPWLKGGGTKHTNPNVR